jgi:hypothetical protein
VYSKGGDTVTHIRRKASLDTPKIIIDDYKAKEKVIEIGEVTGESIKQTLVRLIDAEHKKIKG